MTGKLFPPIENDGESRETVNAMRGGKGGVEIRRFEFGGATLPARFIIYAIPPGASEGQHTHFADDRNGTGAYDEFYYIVAGHGLMTLGEETFPVGQGDYVHAPLDLARGIVNTDPAQTLKIHLTFIDRD